MNFSKEELVEMVYSLGESEKNCFLASRIYQQKFPDARHPQPTAFEKLKQRFEGTGSVSYSKPLKTPYKIDENSELTVLLALQENPHLSSRQMERLYDISKTCVNRITRKHKYHPYHISLHQDLHGNDFQRRINFCTEMLQKCDEDPTFLRSILFSDEAIFKNDGQVNRHNMHYYATENPHWVRQIDFQHPWSLNVWGGILNDEVIGPFFFEDTLNANRYLNFLEDQLPVLLENVNLQTRHNLWYQHDGAPPHHARIVRRFLNNWRGERWIGRSGPIAWPARSPDLTPIDFFLWGYIKDQVYQTAPTTKDDMKNSIRHVFSRITVPMLHNVRQTFLRRCTLCIQQNGNIFEHIV